VSRGTLVRAHRSSGVVAALAGTILAAGLGALAGAPAGATSAPSLPIPLATSIEAGPGGTWATLPMGHLSQPLNTFWQLFYRPAGGTSWSDEVEATAVATNGGLVLASAAGQPLIAAVRPTDLLKFSPLISTADGGRSWSNGVLSEGLVASPAALSTDPQGQTVALVAGGGSTQVWANVVGLSTWRTLTTAPRLASLQGGRVCGLRSLTAVTSLAGGVIVGASCARPGVAGLFTEEAGSWRLDPIALPTPLRQGRVRVLTLEETTRGPAALLGITQRSGTALVAAGMTPGGTWHLSPTLTLGPSQHLKSVGPASASGFFALSASSKGGERLAVVTGAGVSWRAMPTPPAGTATVALAGGSGSTIDALAVHDTTMTVWSLNPGSNHWVRTQVVPVKIEFGSSS